MDLFEEKRKHLKDLNDKQLKERFWELASDITQPLVDFAKTHTSPSIERSVLLRMGFNSMEADAITKKAVEASLLGKGAGNIVLKYAKKTGLSYLDAGKKLIAMEDADKEMKTLFEGGSKR